MTEPTAAEAAIAAAGAKPADLDAGQTTAGAPAAPAIPPNAPPEKTAAEIAADKAKVAAAAAAELEEGPGADAAKAAKEKADADAAALAALDGNKDWQDNYIEFEDPAAKAVVGILKDKGVSVIEANAIFAAAIKSGDTKDVDWATLEKKLGPDAAVLARAGIEQYAAGELAANRTIVTETYKQLGGEANWITVRNWAQAKEATDPAFKAKVDNYRGMINLGGESRELAIGKLKEAYDADPATKGLGVAKLEAGSAPAAAVGEPLSRKDYITELHKAHASRAPAHVIKALDARRTAGKAARI